MPDIRQRKQDHIELALKEEHQCALPTLFDNVRFEHIAAPELCLHNIDVSCQFLDRFCSAPLIIGAMTGGCDNAETINRHLAEAAQVCEIPMALGSQRAALELGLPQNIRQWAPTALLLGNLGGTQLVEGGLPLAQAAVESIRADALMVHLNPLQELAQPQGDHNWTGVLHAIETCCRELDVPVIVKEVGTGIGPTTAKRLLESGVTWIEVAGRGGTNWTTIELARNLSSREREIMQPFSSWGMTSAELVMPLRRLDADLGLIASGGIRNGIDIARCLRLGATMTAVAQPFLEPALQSTDAVVEKIDILTEQLRRTLFLTGSENLTSLRVAPLASSAVT